MHAQTPDQALNRFIVQPVQDFHTAIEGALSPEEYARELYEAMLEDGAAKLERGQDRAAQRALRKAELKVPALASSLLVPCTQTGI